MKKVKTIALLLILFLLAAVAAFISPTAKTKTAYADSSSSYLAGYDVTLNVNENRVVNITEEITVAFRWNTGVYHDIPVNAGELIQNLEVKQVVGDSLRSVYYTVSGEFDDHGNEFVRIDIGDDTRKNEDQVFRITYDYIIAKVTASEKNLMALTPIGGGWPCRIEDINIRVIVPQGWVDDGRTSCFVQSYSVETDVEFSKATENGKTVLSAHVDGVPQYTAVRFDIQFEDGILKNYVDFTPFVFAIIAGIAAVAVILLRLFVFNKSTITPVTNFEAPDGMDPLKMGKLIDNKVNGEDITSMIYYFADKGYLKINLDDKDDPKFIRITQQLPATSTDYEREMFYKLFASGEVVSMSSLTNKFYTTAERVTKMVDAQNKNLYKKSTRTLAIVFTVVAALIMGLAPLLLAMLRITHKYLVFLQFIAVVPLLALYLMSEYLRFNVHKGGKTKFIIPLVYLVVAALTVLAYTFAVPSWILGRGAKATISVICCVIPALSALLLMRTDEYTEQLGGILGFRDFILSAEKDKLETMLEDDPQYYYHVLPYAQVLGVSDIWEKKFEGLTVQPPQWATSSALETYFEFRMWNSLMRHSMSKISTTVVSRPSSSGSSGGFHGGFGGHGGGGHGGGGGGFR